VPRNFVLGIKINAADYVATDYDDEHKHNPTPPDALHHIRIITSWGLIDFIEISGGDYENPGTTPSIFVSRLVTIPRIYDNSQITSPSTFLYIFPPSCANTLLPTSVPNLPSAAHPSHRRPPHPRAALHRLLLQACPPPGHRAGLCALPPPAETTEAARRRRQSFRKGNTGYARVGCSV
jgi:hypothetical protein